MLTSTTNSAIYHTDGGAAVFPIPFPFLDDRHIHAHLRSATGARALQRGRDYAVRRTGDGGCGEIVLLGDLPGPGTELVVQRLLPLTQEILFHNQGPNSPSAVEEAVDKLTMIAQQLADGMAAAEAAAAAAREQAESHGQDGPVPPASDISALSGRVAAVEERSAGLEAAAAGLDAGLADANANLAGVLADIAGVQAGLAGLGALARAADAPADGEAYLRQAGAWLRHEVESADGGASSGGTSGSGGSGASSAPAGAYPGEIRLLPFRPGELPPGWHVLDGAGLSRGTPAFDAVAALPASYVADWRISRNSLKATLPDLRGASFRAAAAGETVGAAVAGAGGAGSGGSTYAMTPAMYLGAS